MNIDEQIGRLNIIHYQIIEIEKVITHAISELINFKKGIEKNEKKQA